MALEKLDGANRNRLFGLLALVILCSCAPTGHQLVSEKPVAPIENLISEKIKGSIVLIESENGSGTGFFVGSDKIATTFHVVAHSGPILVKAPDRGKNWTIEGVVAFDTKNKLVILKIVGESIPLPLGGSDVAQIGESVYIPGYPDGEFKVAEGRVQSIRKSNKWIRLKTIKETNGSPVLNNKGQIIAVIVPYDVGSYGYAVPSIVFEALLSKSVPIEPLSQWQQRKHVRAAAYYSLGREKLDTKDYTGAIVNLDKAIELNPEYVRAHYERGRAQAYLGAHDSAIASWTQVIKMYPDEADAYYSRGGVKAYLGDYAEAIIDLDRAIDLDAEHAKAYGNRGIVKFKLGESKAARGNTTEAQHLYEAAIANCNKAIEIDPEDADAYNNRASAQFGLGKSKAARGNAKETQRLYETAITDCDKAIELDPEHVGAYGNRGALKFRLGEFETIRENAKEARRLYETTITDCDKAIRIDPEYADAYNFRGAAKLALGAPEAAMLDVDKAIQIDPGYVAACQNRARVKCKLGDIESKHGKAETAQRLYREGITEYEKSIQMYEPKDAEAKTADLELTTGRVSTVHIMGWSGTLSNFFNGSGFFVGKDKVVTNLHVVALSGTVFAKLTDREVIYPIKGVTVFDAGNDLVILKIIGEGTPLSLGDSDMVQSGERVITMGYPNRKYKVVEGTIDGIRNTDKWLRMKIDIVGGSSGSPVLNSKGQVIGINAAKYKDYAYAVPSNALKMLLARSKPTEPLMEWQKRAPIRAYAYHIQGHLKSVVGHYRGAIADYDNAIKLNPKTRHTYYQRGNIKAALGKYKKAIADYDKAIQLNPENLDVYKTRGTVKFSLGNLEQAMLDFNKVVQLNPDDADAYNNRGKVRFRFGASEFSRGNADKARELYEGAIEDYTQAIKLNPEDTEAHSNLGAVKSALSAMQGR